MGKFNFLLISFSVSYELEIHLQCCYCLPLNMQARGNELLCCILSCIYFKYFILILLYAFIELFVTIELIDWFMKYNNEFWGNNLCDSLVFYYCVLPRAVFNKIKLIAQVFFFLMTLWILLTASNSVVLPIIYC